LNCHNLTASLFTTFAQERKIYWTTVSYTSDKKKLPYKVFIRKNANNHWCIVWQKGLTQIKFETTSKLLQTRFWSSKLPYAMPVNLIKKNSEDFFLKFEIPTGIWSEKTNMPYVFVRENSIKYWCTIQGLNHNEVLWITSHPC
jgi:hypothetical protein